MERPAKRQKLSESPNFPIPTRTLDLENLQRPQHFRRVPGKIILPRAPDVTVTAGIVEVAINDGSSSTQIAAPTADVAVTLDSLGTLTVPGVSATSSSSPRTGSSSSSSSSSSSARGSGSETPSISSSQHSSDASTSISSSSTISSSASNSYLFFDSSQSATTLSANSTTASATQRTVTVTETSTFHVSYNNGTLIAPSSTQRTSQTSLSSDADSTSGSSTRSTSSSASRFTFGQDFTATSTAYSTATGTDYGNAGVGATATGAGAVAAGGGGNSGGTGTGNGGNNNGNGNNGTSGPVLTPQQTQMVGGIVGSVAGIALVLIVVLYVLRWYRQRLKQQGRLPGQLNPGHSRGDSALIGAAAPMSQASRSSFFPPAAVASSMKKWRPTSVITTMTNTTSTTEAGSEKGFQRVSGRKIPPVLTTGGDQYGGSYGAFEKEIRTPAPRHQHDLSESSFYRDAHGIYVGGSNTDNQPATRSAPTTPVYPAIFSSESARRPSLANMSHTSRRDFANGDLNNAFYRNMNMTPPKPDGVAVFRSSPARTPVTQSPNTSSIRLPIQAPVAMDEDIPEMPLPSPGLYNIQQQRMGSLLSGNGRFKESLI